MSVFHDKSIARRMLQARLDGYTFGFFVRVNAKRHLLLLAICILGIYWMMCIQNYAAFYVLIGITIGMFVRDLAWFRTNRKDWPFREKVTDWQKVQSLANEELPA